MERLVNIGVAVALGLSLGVGGRAEAEAEAEAQDEAEDRRVRLGAGFLLGLSLTALGETFELGGLLAAEIRVGTRVSITGRGGYARILGGETAIIPIWVGAHVLGEPGETSTAFFAVEVGLNIARPDGYEAERWPGVNLGGGVDVGSSSLGLYLSILDVENLRATALIAGTFTLHFLAF